MHKAVMLLLTLTVVAQLDAGNFEHSPWSGLVNLTSLNSTSNEQNVFLSKDELTIYFTSIRGGNLDLYVAHRASAYSDWQSPVNLGATINTPYADFGPNLSNDGHLLFFASTRPGGFGAADIYVAHRDDPNDDFGWSTPENIGAPINTADAEQAPFYLQNAEEGSANLYFNRGSQAEQKADIYCASVGRDGKAQTEAIAVAELNSERNESAVTIRQDGREIFFVTQRPGTAAADIWTSTRRSIHDPWEPPHSAGEPINSPYNDVTANLSHDGRTLIFGSNRPGGLGGTDLWMVTRTPSGN